MNESLQLNIYLYSSNDIPYVKIKNSILFKNSKNNSLNFVYSSFVTFNNLWRMYGMDIYMYYVMYYILM